MSIEHRPLNHGDIWDNFPVADYQGQYKKMLQEDAEVISAEAAMADNLGIKPYSLDGDVIEIGCGGVFQYPVVQRLVSDSSTIYYSDYSPTGCASTQIALGIHGETGRGGKWEQFGDYLIENRPEYALGPNNEIVHPTHRSLELGTMVQMDAANLPRREFVGAVSNFCLDSKNESEEVWEHDTARFVGSVIAGGFIAMTVSLESSGYEVVKSNGNVVLLPAIPKTAGQISDRLRELGVKRLRVAVIDDVGKGIRPELPEGAEQEPTHYSGIGVFMGIAS